MLKSDYMYVEIIIGIILIYVALRALITENRVSKLLYLNVIGFGVPALIALVIKTPFAFVVAAAFFICSTISANAIATSLDKLDDDRGYHDPEIAKCRVKLKLERMRGK